MEVVRVLQCVQHADIELSEAFSTIHNRTVAVQLQYPFLLTRIAWNSLD